MDVVEPLLHKAPPGEVGLVNTMHYLDLKLILAGDILVKVDCASEQYRTEKKWALAFQNAQGHPRIHFFNAWLSRLRQKMGAGAKAKPQLERTLQLSPAFERRSHVTTARSPSFIRLRIGYQQVQPSAGELLG